MDQVQRALGGCNDPSQQEADDSPSDRGSLLMEEVAVDWARHDVAPLPRKNGAAAAASSGTPAKKEIFTSVLVKRVFDVNTVEQTFGVTLGITMMWKLPLETDDEEKQPGAETGPWRCPDGKGPDGKGILYMEEPPDADTDDGDWVPDWTPKFNIGNKTADIYSPNVLYSPTTVGSGRNTRLWVIMEQTTTMTIYEKLELVYFPYDNQDLTILLDCTLGLDKFELIPFSQNNGKPLDHGRVLHTVGMVPDVLKPGYLNDFGFPGKPFTYEFQHVKTANMHSSALKIAIKLERLPAFYVLNVMISMAIICSLIFCAWAIHPADIASRQGADFSLLLTAYAFKLIISDMMPKISYLTMLDYFVMGGFLLILVVTLVHSTLPLMYYRHEENSVLSLPDGIADEEGLVWADRVACYILMGLWSIFVITYTIIFIISRNRELREFDALSTEEMQRTSKVQTIRQHGVLAWDSKFEVCAETNVPSS